MQALLVERIADKDPFHAARFCNTFNRCGFGRFSHQRLTGSGVFLMSGHGSDAVIQHDQLGRTLVIDHIDQAGDPGMEEGGIAQHAHDFFLFAGLFHAVSDRKAAAHAETGIGPVEGREHAQRVAADVTGHDHIKLAQRIEQRSVGTARAEHRRS